MRRAPVRGGAAPSRSAVTLRASYAGHPPHGCGPFIGPTRTTLTSCGETTNILLPLRADPCVIARGVRLWRGKGAWGKGGTGSSVKRSSRVGNAVARLEVDPAKHRAAGVLRIVDAES